jgi:hypothetical protein
LNNSLFYHCCYGLTYIFVQEGQKWQAMGRKNKIVDLDSDQCNKKLQVKHQSQDLPTFEAPLAVMPPLLQDSSHQRGIFCLRKYLTLFIDLVISYILLYIYKRNIFPSATLYSGCLKFDSFCMVTNIGRLLVECKMVPKFCLLKILVL